MNSLSNFRRVWQELTSRGPGGKIFRRQPGDCNPQIASDTAARKLRSSPGDLVVKTTDPLVRLLTVATRSLLP